MKTLRTTFIIIGLVLSINITFAQEATPTVETPVEVTAEVPVDTVTLDSDIVVLITSVVSIVAVVFMAGLTIIKSGGTAQEAIKAGAEKGVRTLIANEGVSGTIETRLLSIPQTQRDWLIELVNLASPITDTSTISKDATQWIKNVLDGSPETGAIVAQSTRDTLETIDDKPIDAVG